MVNWQITAKTIYCDSVGEEVTIIIRKDWSARCTGHSQPPGSGIPRNRNLNACEGLGCHSVIGYVNQLKQEESGKPERSARIL